MPTSVRLRWWSCSDARALLGLDAAVAFELFHPELTEAGDQGLVPLNEIQAGGYAAGALSLDLDQLFDFLTAGNPLGSTADAIADALNAVTSAVDEALCGLDEGALTLPTGWPCSRALIASRICAMPSWAILLRSADQRCGWSRWH